MTFKELRQKNGQTVIEIANKLGIQETTYRKYECSVRLPTASILSQLPNVLKCPTDDVINAYTYHKEVQIKRYGKTNP